MTQNENFIEKVQEIISSLKYCEVAVTNCVPECPRLYSKDQHCGQKTMRDAADLIEILLEKQGCSFCKHLKEHGNSATCWKCGKSGWAGSENCESKWELV